MFSLLLCAAVMLAADDAPAKTDLSDQVKLLVRRLEAPQLSERDDAERKLLDLGPDVLNHLPVVTERTSAETAARVNRIQQRLLRAQAVSAAEPTFVTLKGTDLPLSQVLKEITRQTGNPITDHREAFGEQADDLHVDVDFDKTPFWRAMDELLDKVGLTLYASAGERGAFVVRRGPDAAQRVGSATYAGMFRVEPVRFEAVRDLRNPQMESLKLYFEVSWEPRLQPFAILQPLGEVSAVADTGEAIGVANGEAEPEAMIREGTSATELEVPLALPPRSVKQIKSLKGKLQALVPGAMHDFRFSRLTAPAKNVPFKRIEQRQASATVTIDQVRRNNDVWEVGLRVKFEGPSRALESHRSWILENQAFFEDADKEQIEPGGIEQTLQSNDEVGINYFFELKDGPEKLTFVYRSPITVLETTVDYEFKDLKLP